MLTAVESAWWAQDVHQDMLCSLAGTGIHGGPQRPVAFLMAQHGISLMAGPAGTGPLLGFQSLLTRLNWASYFFVMCGRGRGGEAEGFSD